MATKMLRAAKTALDGLFVTGLVLFLAGCFQWHRVLGLCVGGLLVSGAAWLVHVAHLPKRGD